MGLFSKHKGSVSERFYFTLHFHNLSPWQGNGTSLCVSYQRGSHTGITKPAPPASPRGEVYVWEQQLQLPATLYQDAAAARRGGGKGLGPFQPKELRLALVRADEKGRPVGPSVGTVTLNLADYASLDGRVQQAFPVEGPNGRQLTTSAGAAKLLVTICCRDSKSGAPLEVQPSFTSSIELEESGDLPTRLSTDEEGSRPSSQATDSRPGSRSEAVSGLRSGSSTTAAALPSVPEEAVPAGGAATAAVTGAANGWLSRGIGGAASPLAVVQQQQGVVGVSPQPSSSNLSQEQSAGVYDSDGFLLDQSIDAEASQGLTGSVRRNLGSALEHADDDADDAQGSPEAEVASLVPALSWMRGSSQAYAAAAASAVSASAATQHAAPSAAASAAPSIAAAGHSSTTSASASASASHPGQLGAGSGMPATPVEGGVPPPLQSPHGMSTGQQSILSASGDPAAPFVAPPSTQRRFAQREGEGGTNRRWAWRRDGGAAAASRPHSGAGSIFQRARIASITKEGGPAEGVAGAGAAAGSGAGVVGAGLDRVDTSAFSGTSSIEHLSSTELSLRLSSSEDQAGAAAAAAAAAAGQGGAAAGGALAAGQLPSSPTGGQLAPHNSFGFPSPRQHHQQQQLQRSSLDAAGGGGGGGGAARQRSLLANSSLLRSGAHTPTGATSMLLDSLAQATSLEGVGGAVGGALPSPYTNSLVVEALMQELRNLAALESAVYMAGGRRAFAGDSGRHLHAPARRLARTILALGPHEGVAFGLQTIRAIQVTAGAASGDVHRLTYWWTNTMQLRWMFWALGQGQVLECTQHTAAAGGGSGGGSTMPGASAAAAGWGQQQRELREEEDEEEQGRSGHMSPRAALAAAAARSAAENSLSWMRGLLGPLRELEAWLFREMVKHLWWRVLLQGVSTAAAAQQAAMGSAGGAGGVPLAGTPAATKHELLKRSARSAPHLVHANGSAAHSPAAVQGRTRSFESQEEEAVQHWVDGLAAVERALKDASRPAPAPRTQLALLHRQLIVALLRRLDTLLFRKLLMEEGESPLRMPTLTTSLSTAFSLQRDAFSQSAEADDVLGAGAEALLVLEPGLLPFQRGPVTFGTGVSLKMAVSRLTGWAADCGVKEDRLPQAARSTEMSDYRMFPCLRATADLLMMPKEVLTDPQMRREVVPGLPLHCVCQLLERFEPDDCAPDPLPPGLLEALQSESPRSDGGSTPSPTAKSEEEYLPPAEATLLADGIIEPLSLDMDDDSDEELDTLAHMHTVQPSMSDLASASASASSSGALLAPLGPAGGGIAGSELRAHRFVLLKELWAAAV